MSMIFLYNAVSTWMPTIPRPNKRFSSPHYTTFCKAIEWIRHPGFRMDGHSSAHEPP